MKQTPLLSRTTLGQPNALLLAMATAFFVALIPWGAWRALSGMVSSPTAWLEPDAPEAADLRWLDRQFGSERTVVVSWEGCTLAATEKLSLLARGLAAESIDEAAGDAARGSFFERIVTGPEVVEALVADGMNRHAALTQLEGSFVGPPQRGAASDDEADQSRVTCLIAVLSPAAASDAATARTAIERITELAEKRCGVTRSELRLGGSVVESAGAAHAAWRSLLWTGIVATLVCGGVALVRLRSEIAAAGLAGAAAVGGGLGLALVFYAGVGEVLALHHAAPRWGVLTPLTATLSAAGFMLALVVGLRTASAYKLALLNNDEAPAEAAWRAAWKPTVVAAALASLVALALVITPLGPVREFGAFAALSILGAAAIALAVFSLALHRMPAMKWNNAAITATAAVKAAGGWLDRVAGAAIRNPMPTLIVVGLVLVGACAGALRLDVDARHDAIVSRHTKAAQDRAWLTANLANPKSFDVVIAFPQERLRGANEDAEADGRQYRLSPSERAAMVSAISDRLAAKSDVAHVLSHAALQTDREQLFPPQKSVMAKVTASLLAEEREASTSVPTGRELWRISARLKPTAIDDADDFPALLADAQSAVAPVLLAAAQRDHIVRSLHERGRDLADAKVCILFRAPGDAAKPSEGTQEAELALLLEASGDLSTSVNYFNLAAYDSPGRSTPARNRAARKTMEQRLEANDAVALVSASSDPSARTLFASGVPLVDVSDLPAVEESTVVATVDDGSPRPIRAVLASTDAVEHRIAQIAEASAPTIALTIAGILAAAMVLVTRDVIGGLVTSIAVALPAVAALGVLGWLGVGLAPGAVAIAVTAIALSLYSAVDYFASFRRLRFAGAELVDANQQACRPLAEVWSHAAIIGGLALTPAAWCGFTPLAQFGAMSFVVLAAVAASCLVVLPAMVASPLIRFLDIGADDEQPVDAAAPAGQPGVTRPLVEAPPMAQPAAHADHANGSTRHRTDPAKAPPSHRTHASADDLDEQAVDPHTSLQAKLQQLRRQASRE